jgi:hypothetical protein
MLVLDFTEEDGMVVDSLRRLAPTTLVIPNGELPGVRQAEWDIAVVNGTVPALAPHIFVVTIDPANAGHISGLESRLGPVSVAFTPATPAREFMIPDSISPELRRLVDGDLLPAVRSRRLKLPHGDRGALDDQRRSDDGRR